MLFRLDRSGTHRLGDVDHLLHGRDLLVNNVLDLLQLRVGVLLDGLSLLLLRDLVQLKHLVVVVVAAMVRVHNVDHLARSGGRFLDLHGVVVRVVLDQGLRVVHGVTHSRVVDHNLFGNSLNTLLLLDYCDILRARARPAVKVAIEEATSYNFLGCS